MSVAVIEVNDKHHEIADDRESSPHVITWTALRYMKYEIFDEDKDVKEFFDAFDEARTRDNGTVHGRTSKKALMVTDRMKSRVKFEAKPLNELTEKLNYVYAVRYGEQQSNEQRDRL